MELINDEIHIIGKDSTLDERNDMADRGHEIAQDEWMVVVPVDLVREFVRDHPELFE